MKFESQVLEGKLLRRYKRFFADVDLNGKVIQALVPNTGSMKGCNIPESPCRVTYTDNPNRKIPFTLEMVKTPGSWVGINTARPNHLAKELWQSQTLSHWSKYDRIQSEVKISEKSRVDLVMWKNKNYGEEKLIKADFKKLKGPFHFVEVKNVSMAEESVALFPDSVTLRGQKHIDELMRLMDYGHTAELLFVVQREDCKIFSPADAIDEVYGQKLRAAKKAGLRITPLACQLNNLEIVLSANPLKLKL